MISRKKTSYLLVFLTMLLGIIIGYTLLSINNSQQVVISPMQTFNENEEAIRFVSSWGAYDSKAPRLEKIFQNILSKHKNIAIEDSSMAGSQFLFVLKSDFASNNEPDIFGLWPGSDMELLVKQGLVADLTELVNDNPEWKERFLPEVWEYVTYNDKIYGIPLEMTYEGLFINKDLFEKYDVKVPTNYEELKEAIEIFKANDIIPIAYNATSEGSYIYQNIVTKLGGKEDVVTPFDEEGNIKSCYIDGMNYMKELYELGAFPSDYYLINDKERNDLFINKKAAMIVQGAWFIGDNAVNSNDTTIDILQFPDMPNGKGNDAVTYGPGNGILHISTKAWNDESKRDKCITILKEMTNDESFMELSKESGFIASIEIDNANNTYLGKKGNKLIEEATELVNPVDCCISRNVWDEIIVAQFSSVLRETKTAEQLFEEVEIEYKEENHD